MNQDPFPKIKLTYIMMKLQVLINVPEGNPAISP
jgi:hypothetical protein